MADIDKDYTDLNQVTQLLEKAQKVETDIRDKCREAWNFLNEPDGQWEDTVKESFTGRPRYTFDRCNDIVDDIAGEMEQADFDIRVKPAGGGGTKDLAQTIDGIIRNIEVTSNAVDTYNAAGRRMVGTGVDGWRITQRWGDNNVFDQDLFIDYIPDFVDRVWFDSDSTKQTREDAEWCFVLQSMSMVAYKEKWPDGSGQSVGDDHKWDRDRKPEVVTVGEFLYKTYEDREIVEMTNGSVFEVDDKFQRVADELKQQGVEVQRTRKRRFCTVKTRLFDGHAWLTGAQDTVFEFIPVVPTYGNWSMSQSLPQYWGVITKKMDAQRVYNYTESRKVEETALAPLEKTMVTPEQIGPHKNQWENLNTSSDPALLYEHQPDTPPPYKIGGAQLNPGLESVAASAERNLQSTAGLERLPGEALGLQSGTAVELQQNKGDTRNYKYTASQVRAITHTAKILIPAIKKVYDTERQVRIINQDRSEEVVTLNQTIIDEQTKERVTLNDLSLGIYDVVCDVGPAFKNRQEETAKAFTEIAQIDPGIIQEGKDIWYANLNAPGMDALAERARHSMVLNGQIPPEQLTDDEQEMLQNMPEPEPDPVAQALEAEAEREEVKLDLEGVKVAQKDRELDLKEEDAAIKALLAKQDQQADLLNTQADTLKKIAEALEKLAPPDERIVTEQKQEIAQLQ